MKILFIVIISLFLVHTASCKKKFPKNSVQRKKLVKVDVSAKAVLKNYNVTHSNKKFKPFKGTVFGFVTPWSRVGYYYAIKHSHKFDYISPVWFTVKENPDGSYFIEGNPEEQFLIQMRQTDSRVKIVPRVTVRFDSIEKYETFFQNQTFLSENIMPLLTPFDGVTFEWGFLPYDMVQSDLTPYLERFRELLGTKELVIVVPPIKLGARELFSYSDYLDVKDIVDYVIVMTYDYQGEGLAPLSWVKRSITQISPSQKNKLLMGVQFYGYKYDGGEQPNAVTYNEYLEIMKTYKPKLKWDKSNHEHWFKYKDRKTNQEILVRYPSLKFIQERLKLAKGICKGVSIWEIGQGLEYFFDLF